MLVSAVLAQYDNISNLIVLDFCFKGCSLVITRVAHLYLEPGKCRGMLCSDLMRQDSFMHSEENFHMGYIL